MLKQTVKLGLILFIICVAMALLLGLTNEATKETIALRQLEAQNSAMAEVIPADSYTPLDTGAEEYEIHTASSGDEIVGYAVSLSTTGYGGNIDLMVGVLPDLSVSGVSILNMSETPGLGANADTPEFTDMFKGLKTEKLALTNEGGSIQALSGATVTSHAVTGAVRSAVEIVSSVTSGGAANE